MNAFRSGYNCAQAVVLAFKDELELDEKTLLMLASSFGGGMGRLREVCGAVTGMFIVAGLKYGYLSPDDGKGKAVHYERIQALAADFREKNGSIVCRELLGLEVKRDNPVPEERTPAYYKKRPCVELVGDAAEIIAKYISENDGE